MFVSLIIIIALEIGKQDERPYFDVQFSVKYRRRRDRGDKLREKNVYFRDISPRFRFIRDERRIPNITRLERCHRR